MATLDDELAEHLAGGVPYRRTAELTGTSLATVYRRMQDDQFRNRVALIRDERVALVRRALVAGSTAAVRTLIDVATDTAAPHAARVRAAEAILSRSGHPPRAEVEQVSPEDARAMLLQRLLEVRDAHRAETVEGEVVDDD